MNRTPSRPPCCAFWRSQPAGGGEKEMGWPPQANTSGGGRGGGSAGGAEPQAGRHAGEQKRQPRPQPSQHGGELISAR